MSNSYCILAENQPKKPKLPLMKSERFRELAKVSRQSDSNQFLLKGRNEKNKSLAAS